MDPDLPLPSEKIENTEESKALDPAFRQFRLSLGQVIQQGSVLLVSDPLNQHAQMAFPKSVGIQEISWLSLEAPGKLLREIPRTTVLPATVTAPVDWVVWWHGLEHTRRPAAHLAALRRSAKIGVMVGLPAWGRWGFQKIQAIKRGLPQHRFLAGPDQVKRLAEDLAMRMEGPFSCGDLGRKAGAKDLRWIYRLLI